MKPEIPAENRLPIIKFGSKRRLLMPELKMQNGKKYSFEEVTESCRVFEEFYFNFTN